MIKKCSMSQMNTPNETTTEASDISSLMLETPEEQEEDHKIEKSKHTFSDTTVEDYLECKPSGISHHSPSSLPLLALENETNSTEADLSDFDKQEENKEIINENEKENKIDNKNDNTENKYGNDSQSTNEELQNEDNKSPVISVSDKNEGNFLSKRNSSISLTAFTDVGDKTSPVCSETFYSIENSPGSKKAEFGFSIFEDIVLHSNKVKGGDVSEDNLLSSKTFDIERDSQPSIVLTDGPTVSKEANVTKIDELTTLKVEELHDTQKVDEPLKEQQEISEFIPSRKPSSSSKKSVLTDHSCEDTEVEDKPELELEVQPILPKRYVLLFLLFLGFAVVYSLRVNINVAIVAMVNNRTRLNKNGRIEIIQAEFDWDSHTQALVIGAFYYGYWILQVPGAWIAMKLGATRIFGYGVFLSALLSLITPVATRYHVFGIVGVRVAQGLVLGVTYPCVIAIWAFWSPPLERSTMVTMTMAGSPVGNIIAIPVTGILAKYGFDGGWPSVFYFFGALGVLWYIVWEVVIYDKPDNHPTISANEKRYISKSIGEKPFDPLAESLPWLAIATSKPMWGIIFGHFGACWGYYTLFTQMPTYLKDVQHLDIKTMGLVASTPYLLKALLGPIGGISADMLVKGNYLTIRGVRIFFYGLGCIGAGFFILMTGYYSRKGEAITFLILGVGISGLNATGYAVNHLDLAPRYAGILMGISNTFATIPGFLSPLVTGFITKNKRASEWKIVFWITFIVYIVAVILYTFLCSGEKQWWSEGYVSEIDVVEEEEEEKEEEEEEVEEGEENNEILEDGDDDENEKSDKPPRIGKVIGFISEYETSTLGEVKNVKNDLQHLTSMMKNNYPLDESKHTEEKDSHEDNYALLTNNDKSHEEWTNKSYPKKRNDEYEYSDDNEAVPHKSTLEDNVSKNRLQRTINRKPRRYPSNRANIEKKTEMGNESSIQKWRNGETTP